MNVVENEFYLGVIIASIAYLLKNFLFDQALEYQKAKGRVQNKLKYYSDVICGANINEDLVQETRSEMRQLSCDLEERYFAILILARTGPVRLFFDLPSKEDVTEAAKKLIYLSNSAGGKVEGIDHREEACIEVENRILKGNIKKMIEKVKRILKKLK